MENQYDVTIRLDMTFTTTITVAAHSATQARAFIEAQWDAIGASLAHISDSDTYVWDVGESTLEIEAVEPSEDMPPLS